MCFVGAFSKCAHVCVFVCKKKFYPMIFIHDCIMGDTSPVRTSLIPSHSIHPSHLLFHRSLITISPHSDPPSCVLSAPPLLLLFFPFTSPPSPTLSTSSLPMGRAAEIRPCPNLVAPGRGKRTAASQCPATAWF